MSAILFLIPLSVLIAAAFLTAFIWAVRSGQFEDTCTPSMRLLTEDRLSPAPKTLSSKHNER
jgi:cbb3-type cytochrome oxidase maturation protein